MRLSALPLAFFLLSVACAQTNERPTRSESEQRIPATLAQAHAELERILPQEELARIDAMKSADEMNRYHLNLGMAMRNDWGLWRGSPLKKHFEQLGFTHPDDMSAVILETFWCKRHGRKYLLKERAARYAAFWEETVRFQKKEVERVEKARLTIQSMMMGLRVKPRDVPVARLPARTIWRLDPLRARFLSPYRNGVFVAALKDTGPGDDDFVTEGYYFDPVDRRLHKIAIPEVSTIHSAVVAGETAWFAGITGGKPVLLGIKGQVRTMPALPRVGSPPQLGLHEQELLAVYPDAVFRFAGGSWERIYAGSLPVRRSGPPPRLHGDLLYYRDEGVGGSSKRLWWINIAEQSKPISLDRDVKVVGPDGPRWETAASHVVTDKGDLWACVGGSGGPKSVLRRSKDGTYAVAILNNSVDFAPDLLGREMNTQGLSLCALTVHPNGSLVLVGNTGLYHFDGNELSHDLEFANTDQTIEFDRNKPPFHWRWEPSCVIVLAGNAYFISDAFGGTYLLARAGSETWRFESLDEELGEPIDW